MWNPDRFAEKNCAGIPDLAPDDGTRRPQLSAALFRLRLLPKLQVYRISPTRAMSARCYAIERAFLDKPVQGSELHCVALYKGTTGPASLPQGDSLWQQCAFSCCGVWSVPTCTKESPAALCLKENPSATSVCSVLLLQLAQTGVLLLQVLNSGHDGLVLLLLLLGVCCSLWSSW